MKVIETWEELVERERELAGFATEDEDEEVEELARRWGYDEVEDLEPLERW